jgi:hypothetical protein
MEAIRSSETSVQSTTSTQRHTPEDGILQTSGSFLLTGEISKRMDEDVVE